MSNSKLTFTYGGRPLTLNKSSKYVAFKRNKAAATERDLSSIPTPEGETLGDFELTTVPQERSLDLTSSPADRAIEQLTAAKDVFATQAVYETENRHEEDTVPMIPTGEIYVIFEPNTVWANCHNILKEHSLIIIDVRGARKFITQMTDETLDPVELMISLQQKDRVKVAEADFCIRAAKNALPPVQGQYHGDQWHLDNHGGHTDHSLLLGQPQDVSTFKKGADAKIKAAWQHIGHHGSRDVVVAVTDDGFDIDHPALRGKIVAPWNFQNNTNNPRPGAADNHGTPCAGVAVGAIHSQAVGACPNAQLMPVKTNAVSDSYIEKLFYYCMNNGADIISCSWGIARATYRLSTRMQEILAEVGTKGRNGKGCIICFAAGNFGYSLSDPDDPDAIMGFATHPNVFAIASSNSRDEHSDYSCYGKYILVCAPSNGSDSADGTGSGANITTIAAPYDNVGFTGRDGARYQHSFGGTSSACPLIAGICGLILSVNPNLNAHQVRYILAKTADKIGGDVYDGNGHNKYLGYGRVNTLAAVKMAQRATSTIPELKMGERPPFRKGSAHTIYPTLGEQATILIDGNALVTGKLNSTIPQQVLKISVAQKLTLELNAPNKRDDLAMYLKKDTPPSGADFEQASETLKTSQEKIELSNLSPGDYYVLIKSQKVEGGIDEQFWQTNQRYKLDYGGDYSLKVKFE